MKYQIYIVRSAHVNFIHFLLERKELSLLTFLK